MSCYAVATASAQVELEVPETLKNILDKDSVIVVMLAHLKNKMGDAALYPDSFGRVIVSTDMITFTYDNGRIAGRAKSYQVSEEEVTQAVEELQQVLIAAAGYLLQEKVAQAVGSMAFVENREMASNGSMVLTVNL